MTDVPKYGEVPGWASWLRERRLAQNLSLEDAAAQLRLPQQILEGVERGEIHPLRGLGATELDGYLFLVKVGLGELVEKVYGHAYLDDDVERMPIEVLRDLLRYYRGRAAALAEEKEAIIDAALVFVPLGIADGELKEDVVKQAQKRPPKKLARGMWGFFLATTSGEARLPLFRTPFSSKNPN